MTIERAFERPAVDEDIGRGGTGADSHHGLWPAYLAVDGLDGLNGVVGDRAGDAQNIGVARAASKTPSQLLGVVTRGEAGHQFDVAPVATAGVHMEEPGAAAAAGAHQS